MLIPEQRQWFLTLAAEIASYKKREKYLTMCLALSLVISGIYMHMILSLVG